ncbi:MAG: hypothetical protein ABSA09_08210, partial [Desulfobaccales bacterium]
LIRGRHQHDRTWLDQAVCLGERNLLHYDCVSFAHRRKFAECPASATMAFVHPPCGLKQIWAEKLVRMTSFAGELVGK